MYYLTDCLRVSTMNNIFLIIMRHNFYFSYKTFLDQTLNNRVEIFDFLSQMAWAETKSGLSIGTPEDWSD